jgi:intraflagellar transport protein 122
MLAVLKPQVSWHLHCAEAAKLYLQVRFEDQKVSSVAFNSEHEEMVAYTSRSMLCICTAAYKPYRQRMSSLVVAFSGAKVYCLQSLHVKAEDVPLSSIVQQYIEARSWQQAYRVACLGVTQEDWNSLAHAALLDLNMEVARKAFIRTQDLLMINLVHRLDVAARSGRRPELLRGDVLTYQVGMPAYCTSIEILNDNCA